MKFTGKGVYDGIAIGPVWLFSREGQKVKRTRIDDIETEISRFEYAKEEATAEISGIYKKALTEVGQTNAQIFEIHLMMLEDDDYNASVINIIKTQQVNSEYAVAVTGDNFSDMFRSMDDGYMQARAADVKDISDRLIACLSGHKTAMHLSQPVIICADDLAPSETVSLDKEKVLAFVTAHGSQNSHTAILARNMNIPAIIGLGDEFLNNICDGDIAVANGFTGELIISPDERELAGAKKLQEKEADKKLLLEKLKDKDNVTLDGTRINIYANIGSTDGIGAVLANDADGIGLFRSEFLYLERDDYPDEELQFTEYKKVLESMAGKKVIIRTMDIGADKKVGYFGLANEDNPALGLRAIRLCFERPDIFKTQLRALLRASAYGNLGIMFPMIANLWEIENILKICDNVKSELKADGIAYSDNTEIGIMIETPAAALISDHLAPLVDFFSIGTNDLTQYTLACDRQNPLLDKYCPTHHEAILKLIETTVSNAHKHGKWVGICGELASDLTLTETFLRMGIDELSVSPPLVLKLREKVRSINLKKH